MFRLIFVLFLAWVETSASFISSLGRKSIAGGSVEMQMAMKLLEVKVPLQIDVSQYENMLKAAIPHNADVLRWYILAVDDKKQAVIEVLVDER